MKFSCCLEMIFLEVPFNERIYKAKEAGFDCIEFWLWENKDLSLLKKALDETGLTVGIFQGNIRGRLIDKIDNEVYINDVNKSVETAKYLGAHNLFLMSDIMQEDRSVLETSYPINEEEKLESTKNVLKHLIPSTEESEVHFVIEPLNTKIDHKGYSLNRSAPAFQLIREIGHPYIRVLYDAYHMQIMEGDLINTIRKNIDAIGYFHIADVPGRVQPGAGEINYRNVLKALSDFGYQGIVGFEFTPAGGCSEQIVKNVLETIKP